jgi:hypothetical protein
MHADQIREFGGSPGVRDQGGLESAVAQASATYLHTGLFAMAEGRHPCMCLARSSGRSRGPCLRGSRPHRSLEIAQRKDDGSWSYPRRTDLVFALDRNTRALLLRLTTHRACGVCSGTTTPGGNSIAPSTSGRPRRRRTAASTGNVTPSTVTGAPFSVPPSASHQLRLVFNPRLRQPAMMASMSSASFANIGTNIAFARSQTRASQSFRIQY